MRVNKANYVFEMNYTTINHLQVVMTWESKNGSPRFLKRLGSFFQYKLIVGWSLIYLFISQQTSRCIRTTQTKQTPWSWQIHCQTLRIIAVSEAGAPYENVIKARTRWSFEGTLLTAYIALMLYHFLRVFWKAGFVILNYLCNIQSRKLVGYSFLLSLK